MDTSSLGKDDMVLGECFFSFPSKVEFPKTIELVKTALSVRPGITGQWQVSGRSDVNFDKRIEMDASYSRKISGPFLPALWYDLKILFRTPFAMLSGRGAV